jgi:uncharacterized protein
MPNERELLQHYGPPIERARLKTLRKLDKHCRRFVELSPFVCLGTSGADGADVTPRGDAPGFVHILDDVTLALPDWPGNNRLDSLRNIVENPKVGLLFLIPGVDESLRINGEARITTEAAILARWQTNGRRPKHFSIAARRSSDPSSGTTTTKWTALPSPPMARC